jgi:FSR family fosmidomycin resistance protein-like MFS transporter
MLPGLVLAVGVLVLLPEFEPHNTGRLTRALDRRMFTGTIGWLAVAASLVSLAFITFTSAVPLWLVTAHEVHTDASLLGAVLGLFSLGAGAGAVAGGALGARFGYARITLVSLLAAVPALTGVLMVRPGVATLGLAASAGALIYASQPLLLVAAQNAAPANPAAAAGVVLGVGSAIAGLLYVGVGVLQGLIGLAPAMTLIFTLLVPAAVIASRELAR